VNLPRSGAFLLLAALAASTAWAGEAATIKASAGFGGLCRPGRWTPVRVDVDYGGADATGEIAVEWGDARTRRAISLSAHAHKQFELYIRTPDARDSMTVHLLADGREIAAANAPVRLVAPADALTICVAAAEAMPMSGVTCTATLNASALPRSWRGYGAADEVVWQPGRKPTLTADQEKALTEWRGVQAIENAEQSSPSLAEIRPPIDALRRTRNLTLLYAVALGVFALPFSRIRSRSLVVYPAVAALVIAGTVAAMASGRIGPGATARVAQTAVVRQLPGARGSFVLARGVAEFPTFGAAELTAARADGAIASRGAARRDLRFDENGAPLLAGIFGLGATTAFEMEAVTAFEALRVESHGETVRVSNSSTQTLKDCRFGDGFSKTSVGSLAPGQRVEAVRQGAQAEEEFTCRLDAPIVELVENRRPVVSGGTAVIIASLAERQGQP